MLIQGGYVNGVELSRIYDKGELVFEKENPVQFVSDGRVFYLDSRYEDTLNTVLERVESWDDMDGNGAATKFSNATRPSYGLSTINGHKVVKCDVSQGNLRLPSSLYGLTNGPYTVMALYKKGNISTTGQRIISGNGSNNIILREISSQFSVTVGTGTASFAMPINLADAKVGFLRRDGADYQAGKNGNEITVSGTNGTDSTVTSFGLFVNPADNSERLVDGELGVLLIYDRYLTDEEIDQNLEVFERDWGVDVTYFTRPDAPELQSLWTGDVSEDQATIQAFFTDEPTTVRCAVSVNEDMSSSSYNTLSVSGDAVKFSIDDLTPNTTYYYKMEVDGVLDAKQGKFQTLAATPQSFRVGFSSCCELGTGRDVFNTILSYDPLAMFYLGDFPYKDTTSTDVAVHLSYTKDFLKNSKVAPAMRSCQNLYIFDDHDFAANNPDKNSPSRDAAIAMYRNYIPHPPLAQSGATDGIYFSKVIYDVLFIALDVRSYQDPTGQSDNSSKSRLGAVQKQWLKDTLAANTDKFVVLFTIVPWLSASDSDTWAGYKTERAELADYMKSLGMEGRVIACAGDAHMIAYDDGTNCDYATGGGMDMKVFQAAPLSRAASTKGGPYSGGTFPATGGQFGLLDFEYDGSDLNITFQGIREGAGVITSYSFTVSLN